MPPIATRCFTLGAMLYTVAAPDAFALQRGRGGRGSPSVTGIETRTYRMPETNRTMPYDVFVSRKVDASKPAPLIIFLHGLNTPARRLLGFLTEEADKRGYIMAAPV